MLMHTGIAASDALAAGDIGAALGSLFHRSVALSAWSLISEVPQLRRLQRAPAA
jgi:hypothetical protein